MTAPRIVRPLSIDSPDAEDAILQPGSAVSDRPDVSRLTKLELQELFRKEIHELAKQEIELREKELRQKLQKQFDARLSKAELDYEAKAKQLDARLKLATTLVESLEAAKKQDIIEAIGSMDAILIELCMESLYKIAGEREIFEKVVTKTIKAVSAMHAANIRVKVNVSEEAFNFLRGQQQDFDLSSHLQLDTSLKAGQIRIDDGVSITEAGLVDQLDNLREALLAELRKNYEL